MSLVCRFLSRTTAALAVSAANIALVPIALMPVSPRVHALTTLPEQTRTSVNGIYSADGSGVRTDWFLGAYQLLSAGAFNQAQSGGAVTLGVSAGQYTVSIGSNPQSVATLSNGGPATPWASGLLAVSKGSDGQTWGLEGDGYDSAGGYGGAVRLTVSPANPLGPVEILLDTTTLPPVTGTLTLNGVLALSQGGAQFRAVDLRALHGAQRLLLATG